ncbi:hypothetical protein SD70_01935 [Gordoniibacillus kamchatkensis]|uniref:Uncharacterized protein n=2 Tax=Gordoniibacillus kamchatkensis TaxID=1590651 RepID=A0ABR5AMR4_9BACL|nr:hypothetical protein SD70_01935 [Paenibacillus sp. VKM B-2647]
MNDPNDQNWGSYNFAVRDRARWHGEGFALTVDWIYSYLTAQDKADIQKVFLYWANAINTQYQSPIDHGLNGVPDTGPKARNATNNYYTGLFRNLVMMVLSLDPADDPPVDPTKDALAWGNSLRSYMPYIQNRWMKQLYAQYGPGGAAEGGAHPEGSYYGLENMGFFRQAILALETAGYNDPSVSGPYIDITDMPFWDGLIDATIKSTPNNPVIVPPSSYMGKVFQIDNYGDNQHFWLPDASLTQSFAPMGIYDGLKGNTARLNTDKWLVRDFAPGGAPYLYAHAANIWPNNYASLAIFYFMLFDPNAPAPADPRPGMSTSFFAKGMGRMADRTSWSAGASLFTFLSSHQSVGHQHGYSGMFGFNRKNEWLTKELTQYASDNKGLASEFHNTLSLKNDDLPASALSSEWWAAEINKRGGQWVYAGYNNGDPTLTTSMQNDYDYAQTDLTNLYNNPYGAKDILHASRSIVWLKPDMIVIYDRAASGTDGRFKRFNLWLPSQPTITGNTASALSLSGTQKLNVTSLQPAGGALTVTSSTYEPINAIASDEPMHAKLVIEDPTNPKNVRFLTVLEGLDAGASPSQAVGIQSSGGTAFAGAAVNQTAVLFPVDIAKPFSGVTYTVQSGVSKQLVTGLTPNAKYDVAVQNAADGVQITVTQGSTYQPIAAACWSSAINRD